MVGPGLNSKDPLIYEFKSFINISICQHIINVAKDKMKRAKVIGEKQGFISKNRTNSYCWIPLEHNTIFKDLSSRIAIFLNKEISSAENFQIIH